MKHPVGYGKVKLVSLIELAGRQIPATQDSLVFTARQVFERPGDQIRARSTPRRSYYLRIIGYKGSQLVEAAQGLSGLAKKATNSGSSLASNRLKGFTTQNLLGAGLGSM